MSMDEVTYGLDAPGDITSPYFVTLGDLTAGTISPKGGVAGDHDFYRLITEPGVRYTIVGFAVAWPPVEGVQANPWPYFEVRNSAGLLVGSSSLDDFMPIYSFTSYSTSTYFIDVQGFVSSSVGTYVLSVGSSVIDDYTLHADLPIGAQLTGYLETAGDEDIFDLSLEAGRNYFFAADSTNVTDLTLTIETLFGDNVGFGQYGGRWNTFTPASSGLYELGVRSESLRAEGGYVVHAGERLDATKEFAIGGNAASTLTFNDSVDREVWGWGGSDYISTGSGDDILVGGDGNDTLLGGSGNDLLRGGGGADSLEGGAGIDKSLFGGSRANFTIAASGNGFSVSAKAGSEGIDRLLGVERALFDDVAVAFDITPTGNIDDPATKGEGGNAGKAYRLYQAAFDRTPDLEGLGYWIMQVDNGESLFNIASGFLQSAEFKALYGANPSNAEYTRALYLNVLNREPDASGYAYWNALLSGEAWNGTYYGQTTRQQMLVDFSEGAENKANLLSVIGNGFDYLPWAE